MGTKMILFLLTFLFLYGGINFYFFFRARSVLHFTGLLQGLALILILLLIIAPVLVRVAESFHLEPLARTIACIGYIWMAFVFFFFFLSVSLELIRALHKLIDPSASVVTLKTASFWLSVILSFVLVVYGYIDAGRIRVKHLEIKTQQVLPEK